KNGSFYVVPRLRRRPKYPNLNEHVTEKLKRDGSSYDGAACAKYYSTYSEPSLSPGAMVFLCEHSYYIGFHLFVASEGRNDPFSTIITRFEKCPDILVGDNNCQGADYCSLREFDFFKNCRFVIDDFHSFSHTGCSQASFASHYRADTRLSRLNTSLTESANKKMGNLRKAAGYMSERHALIFIQTFVCMVNRGR
ncbi:hypothetical protein BC829DRAFT_358073, partial [Chytridium lagenaria]